MAEKGMVLPSFKESMVALIEEKTPAEFIKKREGPGGITLDYVEVGYVINQLNKIFGRLWDFEILDETVGANQIWVKGQLRVWLAPNFAITKTQYGGAKVKRTRDTKVIIDVGNDLKAAAADALKKCASYLGIAGDIYWPNKGA